MSYSSLYGIKRDYTGECVADYKNSFLFSPVVCNVLSDKTLPRRMGMIQSIIGSGQEVWEKINRNMNNSDCTSDRICWELSNQMIFFTKDKEVIIKAIKDFLINNSNYYISEEDGISVLKMEHIVERFNEIANTIQELDENEYPYFVFKSTSVDDSVSRWFESYNKETDEYESSSLKSLKESVTEFVVIQNNKISDYVLNTKYKFSELEKCMK